MDNLTQLAERAVKEQLGTETDVAYRLCATAYDSIDAAINKLLDSDFKDIRGKLTSIRKSIYDVLNEL